MQLHNTLTRRVEQFTPLHDSHITMYTCGPTVYGDLHVGNWVSYLRWDILVRSLKASGYTVERVMNVTDVGHLTGENKGDANTGEDKMQKGARREGSTVWDVAAKYTQAFLEGSSELNLLPPEHLAKATDYIEQQINLVMELEENGHTYIIDDGVYFDTSTFPTYADFAHLDLDGLRAGARVTYSDAKRNPSDFALWKFSPVNEGRAMEWDSPWGRGFPGWHLECSAMAMSLLGPTLDIHTGGIDHIPVHHTNEIAQSEAASGQRFANTWLHANFLTVNGTKISKSLGNGFTLDDIKSRGFTPEDFRMFVLQSHYRTESNFSWENIGAAANRLKHWKTIASLRHQTSNAPADDSYSKSIPLQLKAATENALHSLQDDINTPVAIAALESVFSVIESKRLLRAHLPALVELLEWIDDTLGFTLMSTTPDISETAKLLIDERTRARESKDWAKSDELRDKLLDQGINVRDTPHGTVWS